MVDEMARTRHHSLAQRERRSRPFRRPARPARALFVEVDAGGAGDQRMGQALGSNCIHYIELDYPSVPLITSHSVTA